jgi:hypothetical protein
LIQRFILTYAFFTGAIWLISYGMEINGAAGSWNPVWLWVLGIRTACTNLIIWSIEFCAVVALLAALFATAEGLYRRRAARKQKLLDDEIAESNRALWHRQQLRESQWQAQEERERERQRENARLQREQQEAEKAMQKQQRSAEDAVRGALGDF